MLSFLKTLLIIIWAYYGLKLLLRLLRPFLMRYVTKKLINNPRPPKKSPSKKQVQKLLVNMSILKKLMIDRRCI
jgi:hypothetical protein